MPSESPIELSVVMPAYNEEKNILEAIRRVDVFMKLKNWEWELLISSDGCTDRTDRLVAEYLKTRPDSRVKLLTADRNRGKGASVRQGVLAAQGRMILVTDVDLSSPIKEGDRLIAALNDGADVAIGSRAVRSKDCDVQQSFKRYIAGRIFNFFVKCLVLKGFHDTQCGFKCFKREAAKTLFAAQKLDGFSFDVEVLCLALKKGYKVKEVPVMWKQGATSRVSLFKDSLAMLKELFYLRGAIR